MQVGPLMFVQPESFKRFRIYACASSNRFQQYGVYRSLQQRWALGTLLGTSHSYGISDASRLSDDPVCKDGLLSLSFLGCLGI